MIIKFIGSAVLTVAIFFGATATPSQAHNSATQALVVRERAGFHHQPLASLSVAAQACGARYVVRQGDTLAAIARRCGVTVNALVRANGLASANLIRVGQVLVVTSGVARPAPSNPAPQRSRQVAPRIAATPAPQAPAEPPAPTPRIEPTVSEW